MAATIHANARTTPKIRTDIQAPPSVSNAALARRYGVTKATIAKWRRVDDFVFSEVSGELLYSSRLRVDAQLLAAARMVLQDPGIVMLDEATSALDVSTERDLHQALQAFCEGRTTLIAAHRLSAMRQAQTGRWCSRMVRSSRTAVTSSSIQGGGLYARL